MPIKYPLIQCIVRKSVIFGDKIGGSMTNLGYSFIPVHPGEVIKEELQSRGISQKRFAEIIDVSYTMMNDILNGKRPLSTDFALLVEAATGINADMLVNMQTRYTMQVDIGLYYISV